MNLQNEYLIVLDSEKSSGIYKLCKDINRFNELLESSIDNISIHDTKVSFENKDFIYNIKKGKVKNKEQIFYYVTVSCTDKNDYDIFKEFLRSFKKAIRSSKLRIETFRDDFTFYYAGKVYSLIHNLENKMRKLINYFMITNVGTDWHNIHIPDEIKDTIRNSDRNEFGVLHALNFIDLNYFLFNSYNTNSINSLYSLIEGFESGDDISILKKHLPTTNWDKYFSKIIECEKDFLQKRWEKLYKLRNKVAHNSDFNIQDYDNSIRLIEEVEKEVDKALIKINSIVVSDEQIEINTDDVLNISNITRYLTEFNKLEIFLRLKASEISESYDFTSDYIRIIKEKEIYANAKINNIEELNLFQVKLKEETDSITNDDLETYLNKLTTLNDEIIN